MFTHYTISQYKNENHPKLCQICNYEICSKGPKNEFETSVVNEPSVFEPLEFYCIYTLPIRQPYIRVQIKFFLNIRTLNTKRNAHNVLFFIHGTVRSQVLSNHCIDYDFYLTTLHD